MIFRKPLRDVEEQDIQRLINDQIEENSYLDYKSDIDFSDKGKKELAKDISAFANSSGGVIIYGIEEEKNKDGIPLPVEPIKGIESSIERERIENIILNNISPRAQLEIKRIQLSGDPSKSVFVIMVPQSLQAPHMVTKSGDNRYYKRVNFSSIPMEEYEVRDLFRRNSQMSEKISEIERTKLRDRNDDGTPWICILSVPEVISGDLFKIDSEVQDWLQSVINETLYEKNYLRVIIRAFGSGFVAKEEENKKVKFLIEIGKNGVVEWGSSHLFSVENQSPIFFSFIFAKELFGLLNFLGVFYEKMDYFGFIRLNIKLSNAKDYLVKDPLIRLKGELRFEDPTLLLNPREFLMSDFLEKYRKYVREIMNELFNTFGELGCPYFDDEDNLKNFRVWRF